MSPVKIDHNVAPVEDALVPLICRVKNIIPQTSDVVSLRITALDGTRPFESKPGQTAMLSVIPYGECMFAVSSQGTDQGEDYLELTVKNVGYVTEQIHALKPGDQVGLRGPYGNWFPYEELKGRDILFVGGGIGMAPLRSLLTYMFDHRTDYGHIDLVYSGSTMDDLVYYQDITTNWPQLDDVNVYLTVYKATEGWTGEVGFTAPYLEGLGFKPTGQAVVLCGGPSLFKTCLESLLRMGFAENDIITTLEARMKCGVGKCGRCNVGSRYICLEGPVFTLEELRSMPGSLH